MKLLRYLCIALLLFSCKEAVKAPEAIVQPKIGLITEKAMVVSAREEAS